jgi:phenylalanyl-tRNA synthetase beta chain
VGTPDLSVFEIGKVYFQDNQGEVGEKLAVAGAMVGSQWRSSWALPAETLNADFFFCKGIIESLLAGLGIAGARYESVSHSLLHATRSANLSVDGRQLGILGEVSPAVLQALDLRERACAFELDFNALMESAPKVTKCAELPRYPAMNRHIAAVVTDDVKYEDVAEVVARSGGDIFERVDLLDLYKGKHIAADQRSLTLSLEFRSPERTLTDEEVTARLEIIKEALSREVGASFR